MHVAGSSSGLYGVLEIYDKEQKQRTGPPGLQSDPGLGDKGSILRI